MVTVTLMQPANWEIVQSIYLEGIETGDATFQQDVPDWDAWNRDHLTHSRLVALIIDQIVGWAALSPVSKRQVYAGVAEVSVYVSEKYRGQKVGNTLLEHLIKHSETNNIWTLQSSIFRENKASIYIHECNGFRFVGYREKIGQMNGIWRDTLLFERRSRTVGNG